MGERHGLFKKYGGIEHMGLMCECTGQGDVTQVNNLPVTPDLILYVTASDSTLNPTILRLALLRSIPIRWVGLPRL